MVVPWAYIGRKAGSVRMRRASRPMLASSNQRPSGSSAKPISRSSAASAMRAQRPRPWGVRSQAQARLNADTVERRLLSSATPKAIHPRQANGSSACAGSVGLICVAAIKLNARRRSATARLNQPQKGMRAARTGMVAASRVGEAAGARPRARQNSARPAAVNSAPSRVGRPRWK